VATIAGHEDIPRLFPVVEWIDQHLEDNLISVRDLARRVYLSETHFRRLFKQVFGTSPIKFIRNRRIDHACALLRTSKLSVKEISQQCGFNDTSFFSRVFRSVTGQTPANYRHSELL
jgi:AraC-like DNA-binding protein